MRKFFFPLLAGGALFGMASCQKVIDLNLGDSSPQVVIEGQITDSLQPWSVQLSKSVLFTDNNQIVPVSGAKVWIKDATAGSTDTLSEVAPGIYLNRVLQAGMPGHRYELTVQTPQDGNFTSVSTMPVKVPFDSLYLETATIFGRRGGQLYPVYTDPAGIANFYRFQIFIRGKREGSNTRDDRFSDGKVNGQPVGLRIDDSIKAGEVVTLEMQCIDASVFKYFSTLRQSDGNSAAPANPISNITGGALGYFSAFTVSRRSVVIP